MRLMVTLLVVAGACDDALDQRQSDVERYQVALQKALAVFSRLPADWKPSDDLPSAGERASELQRLFADARGE